MKEDSCFDKLLNYFTLAIEIICEDDKIMVNDEIPIKEFYSFSMNLSSKFIGECNRRIVIHKDDPAFIRREFFEIRNKFLHFFNDEFSQPYIINNPPDLSRLIPGEDELSTLKRQAVKTKLSTYRLVIDFLDNQIQRLPENIITPTQNRNRLKADKRDFKTNLNVVQLDDAFKLSQRLNFISKKTNKKHFIDIFQGNPTSGAIDWCGTVFSLNRFFTGINGEAIKRKITDGKWDVVSELFTANGEKIKASSLRSPGRGENDRLDELERLIDFLNSSESSDE